MITTIYRSRLRCGDCGGIFTRYDQFIAHDCDECRRHAQESKLEQALRAAGLLEAAG